MNRFPKMMILWKVFYEEQGVDPMLAMALGHAVATSFAIAKMMPRRGSGTSKKGESKGGNLRREDSDYFPIPYIPHKGVEIRRTRNGYEYKLPSRGKERWVNGTQKYLYTIQTKFQDMDEYDKYLKVAEDIVRELTIYGQTAWKKLWWKVWKEIRDKDWATLDTAPIIETIDRRMGKIFENEEART